ncbi:DVU0298 family protein [Desulfitobacterium sp.]|uniref:DVU0298 family protein n=1 Tax=Desulfitobacterium sp. TaxID=49981 RepID=UPI002B200E43|nr:DVU0298 family protein [Desulfitobacterium sp.]MEA4901765.1 methylated-DNA--[protein]-cysteine S-methyltransferase [Desulfitobacterium sp.]
MNKSVLQQILLESDWKSLREKVVNDSGIIRQLQSRVFVKDGLQFWRAIEGLGIAVKVLEDHKPGYAAELVRRYFWNLNEESGGTAWNASEAIGSIIAHCPKQCGHFNWMYSALLNDESLNEGTLWGLAQMACVAPILVEPLAEVVLPFLESSDPQLRGRACLVQAIMQGWGKNRTERMKMEHRQDKAKIELYVNGRLQVYSLAELLEPQIVYYWQEEMTIDEWTWNVTVATNAQGVIWVGLGDEDEEQLKIHCQRWYPQAFLLKRRLPNAQVLEQLHEYFLGQRQEFTVPLNPMGTSFQLSVWEELKKIPYGVTCCYGEIAERLGNPKAQRAIGMANNHNPIGVIVPCHRVIGKNGALVGYAGGIHLKEHLLSLEKQNDAARK